MAEYTGPLRLSVEQHQDLITLSDTPDINRPGRSLGNAETCNPFFRDKQPGYSLRQYGKQRPGPGPDPDRAIGA